MKSWGVLLAAGLVIALPFVFRKAPPEGAWQEGDPVLVVISPHNEAIRSEFAIGFSKWRQAKGERPVKIDWRVVGGTSEISRYLNAEMQASFKAWWIREGRTWPRGASEVVTSRRFDPNGRDPELLALRAALRANDNYEDFGTGLDIFFGGGVYDHNRSGKEGLTVAPWPNGIPQRLTHDEAGRLMLPAGLSGEEWRGETFVGTALSTFGIVANLDRLNDLGVSQRPAEWIDLADPVYFRELGVSDPTKSGSIAKAFEMLIHQQIFIAVQNAGFNSEDISRFEANLDAAPESYDQAIVEGWANGVNLVRLIGANARYFTDSASKVPIDVSMGNATVGLAIDFYGRYQAESSRSPEGKERMIYQTPIGGSSVSADPISLLRGAPHRDLAIEFIEFTISPEGQQLWNYRAGSPGGPEKFSLRRLPIRRDFYPSEDPEIQARFERHAPYFTDQLADPSVNPYYLASQFEYIPRWTAGHFGIHRYLIRAMSLDASEELTAAWQAIQDAGGPEAVPEAMEALLMLPPDLNWHTALGEDYRSTRQMDYMREWVIFFREQYNLAKALAEGNDA